MSMTDQDLEDLLWTRADTGPPALTPARPPAGLEQLLGVRAHTCARKNRGTPLLSPLMRHAFRLSVHNLQTEGVKAPEGLLEYKVGGRKRCVPKALHPGDWLVLFRRQPHECYFCCDAHPTWRLLFSWQETAVCFLFKSRHLYKSTVFVLTLREYPRTTFFLLYLFNYKSSYLPLLHLTCPSRGAQYDVTKVSWYTYEVGKVNR